MACLNPTKYLLQFGIDIIIRQAAPADAPVITDFNLRLAQETEDLALEEPRVRKGVAAILQDPAKGLYFVAEIDGTVAGQVMITYEWSDWRNGNLWWLQSVYVKDEFRGRGVFRALFTYLRDLAQKEAGVAGIRLYMHAANDRARRSYEALGMSQTNYVVFELDSSHAAGRG